VQKATAALLGLALVLLTARSFNGLRASVHPSEPIRVDGVAYQVDLNQAERAELLQLPAVGESLAQRILDYRREHGGFQRVEDLRRVKGIGQLTLERLRPWVCVTESNEPANDEDAPPRPFPLAGAATNKPEVAENGTPGKKLTQDDVPLDLNRATAEDLKRLPGVGPKLANAIIAARDKKPFTCVEELRQVKGIGPKTWDKVRPFVTVGNDRQKVAAQE
jgi:competence protein ComEA